MMETLEDALATALKLPYEQQEMLIQILQNRLSENRRTEIATDAQQTLAEFRSGHFIAQSAEQVIASLNQSLDDSEE